MSNAFYTSNNVQTIPISNIEHIVAKVHADLMRWKRFYGEPTDDELESILMRELSLLLKHNILDYVIYGFWLEGKGWTEALKYHMRQTGVMTLDQDPCGMKYVKFSSKARFRSLVVYNGKWINDRDTKRRVLLDTPLEREKKEDNTTRHNWHWTRSYSKLGGLVRLAFVEPVTKKKENISC